MISRTNGARPVGPSRLPGLVGILVISFSVVAGCYVLALPSDNLDHKLFLRVWIESLDAVGLLGTLGERVANYTAPYMVVLAAVNALLPEAPTLTVMHATGLVLHLFLAAVLFVTAISVRPEARLTIVVPMAVLAPTSLVNGIVWGQSDPFFTAVVLLAALLAIDERWIPAFVAFSAAISIKLVAVFAAPALLVILVRAGALRRIVWLPLILPATYLAMNLPYLLAGVPVGDVLTIYLEQATTYERLSMNAPNFWYLLEQHPATMDVVHAHRGPLAAIGLSLGAAAALALCAMGVSGRSGPLDPVDQLWLLAVSALLLPLLLTKMHDRYFFLADVTLWLLAMIERRFLLPAILAQAGSLAAYSAFLDLLPPGFPVPAHYMVSLGAGLMLCAAIGLLWVGLQAGNVRRVFGRKFMHSSGTTR